MSLSGPLAALLCLLLGLAPVRALGGARSALERAGLSLLVGCASLSFLVVAWSYVVGPLAPSAGRVLLAVVAGLAGFGIWRTRGAASLAFAPERWSVGTLLGSALAIWLGLFCLFYAFTTPVHGFDPIFHYAHKGAVLFEEGFGVEAWTRLEGEFGRVMTHPDYPPGWPALIVACSWLSGGFDPDGARFLAGALALAAGLVLWGRLRSRGRGAAAFGALLWLGLPVLFYLRLPHEESVPALRGLLTGEGWTAPLAERMRSGAMDAGWRRPGGWVMDGAGDLPVAAYLLGALALLTHARSVGQGCLAGACLGGALLTKNEGLALGAVLCSSALLVLALRRVATRAALDRAQLCAPLVALLVAAMYFAPWKLAAREVPSIDEGYPSLLRPAVLRAQLSENGLLVAREFFATWFNPLAWNLLWPAFFAALVCGALRPRRLLASDALLPVLVVLGGLVLYAAILVVTPWDLNVLFHTGIPDRLFVHLAPAAALATLALALPRRAEASS